MVEPKESTSVALMARLTKFALAPTAQSTLTAALLKTPVAAVFKATLEVVDNATPSVLFWNGAPEVSGVGTTLPEGAESVVPLAEYSTWKAEHMLAVLSLETNSPVSLLR